MNIAELNRWFSKERQTKIIERLISSQDVGLTEKRARYLVRLCAYLCIKQRQESQPDAIPPLPDLTPPENFIICTHREAHDLFYGDQERGSERAAGLMMKTLSGLGFMKYRSTGNATQVLIQPLPQLLENFQTQPQATLKVDDFNPRGDAIPLSALLANNYNWMNHNTRTIPHRISSLLRTWADQYSTGMRVLRRTDNQNPVGFYLLYPITRESEQAFSGPPNEGLHLGSLSDTDPFELAKPGDKSCRSLFVRSWIIEEAYQEDYLVPFLEDVQSTLEKVREDFPNLCDLWTLIIHPSYDRLATKVGFQRYNLNTGNTLYWMYQSFDRFVALEMKTELGDS